MMNNNLDDLKTLGTFQIFSMMEGAEDKCFDVESGSYEAEANLILFQNHGQDNQRFVIHEAGDGFYVIEVKNTGMVLDIKQAKQGNSICQYPYHGGDNQLWYIEEVHLGTFRMISKCNRMVIDVKNCEAEDRTPIIAWEDNGQPNQEFWFRIIEW
ncbi:MAG: RICIN domain-containing protein [Lachnospiraceae bacterium]